MKDLRDKNVDVKWSESPMRTDLNAWLRKADAVKTFMYKIFFPVLGVLCVLAILIKPEFCATTIANWFNNFIGVLINRIKI